MRVKSKQRKGLQQTKREGLQECTNLSKELEAGRGPDQQGQEPHQAQ